MQKGKLYCYCISRTKELNAAKLRIFGVRFPKFSPEGWLVSSHLSPSVELWDDAQQLKKDNVWNEESFRSMYEPRFRGEIRQNQNALNEIAQMYETLNNGENVIFSCYCGNSNICHRRIIGEIFENNGFIVEYD